MTYCPPASVATLRALWVSVLVYVTLTPAIAAPDASVTVPETRPKLVCAMADAHAAAKRTIVRKNTITPSKKRYVLS